MKPFINRYVTDFFMIENAYRTNGFAIEKHFHQECEVYYLLEGSGKYFIENETYWVKKGSLVIIDSLQVHHTDFKEGKHHQRILIELNVDDLEPQIKSLFGVSAKDFFRSRAGVYQVAEANQPYLEGLFKSLLNEMKHKHTHFESMAFLKLSELFIHISRPENQAVHFISTANFQPETSSVVKKCIKVIMRDLEASLSLESIAEELHISKNYLSRIFKDVTGLTVHEYINIQRIKKSQNLLETSQLSILDIAQRSGYNSVSYFERVFKKYTETTPIKYQKRLEALKEKARPMR